MKIIDGLKLRGKPAEIPDCSRDDLPGFFVKMGYKIGAEVGIDRGEFSEKICEAGLGLYAIDPWLAYGDYDGTGNQKWFDSSYKHAQKVLSIYPKAKIIRKTSMEAVSDYPDGSLDFVYLDGNHQFKYIAEDVYEWSKKIKKGGAIAGHDYIYTNPRTLSGTCHVIYVVNAYTQAYHITNWYLLGRKERRNNESRDRFRSWMFIKP